MISFNDAIRVIAEAPRTEPIKLPLLQCRDLILAESVFASFDKPDHRSSAMDGFAVRFADLQAAGKRLILKDASKPGEPSQIASISTGEAIRVFTGAKVPDGADHVLPQEAASVEDGLVACTHPQREPRHIRKIGVDFHKGDKLLSAGNKCSAAHIGLAAAANLSQLAVFPRKSVAVFATGSELVEPGNQRNYGQVVNSNAYAIVSLLEALGASPSYLGIAADNPHSIRAMIESSGDHDIILPIGGASVGDYDLVYDTFVEAGMSAEFRNINMRPGKPCWFGNLDHSQVLGLPGNPAAAFIAARVLLPALLNCNTDLPLTQIRLADSIDENRDYTKFVRAEITAQEGVLTVSPINRTDTSSTMSLVKSDGLIFRPPNSTALAPGASVPVLYMRP